MGGKSLRAETKAVLKPVQRSNFGGCNIKILQIRNTYNDEDAIADPRRTDG